MSRQEKVPAHRQDKELRNVKVEVIQQHQRRSPRSTGSYDRGSKGVQKVSSITSDYVYVNSAYVGNLGSVNDVRNPAHVPPITSVYREQYWTCSRWSFGKRGLAIAVGVILGATIGMIVTFITIPGDKAEDLIGGYFRSSAPD